MQHAFEYEWKGYDRKGRPIERRWSIGAVVVRGFVGLLLALSGHTLINGLVKLWLAVKWW
jgi:hypothetical protein